MRSTFLLIVICFGYATVVHSQSPATGETRFCDQYPGINAGSKIAACIAAIPDSGGIADASRLQGEQVINSSIDIGTPRKPVLLLLGMASYTLNSASLRVFSGSYVVGSGTGREAGKGTTIRRASGREPVIVATGKPGDHIRGFGLRQLVIDGGGAEADGIVFRYCDTFYIEDVHVLHGAASSALRLLDEIWDFWVVNSAFTLWGDVVHPTIELAGANAAAAITDGHWQSNQFGELGTDSPILVSNAFVLQQRFIDSKFHITGTRMPYMIDWSGYRSAFVNCSFQGDGASARGGVVVIRNADNQIIGGHFTDINHGDALEVVGDGDASIIGVTFRSAGVPGPGSAVVTGNTSHGHVTMIGNSISNFSVGYNFRAGNAKISLGATTFEGTTIDIAFSERNGMWGEYNAGKMTAVFGGNNLPTPRSPIVLNPTVRIGGNVAANSAGYQGLYLFPLYRDSGQINELLGMGANWLAGIGAVVGRNVEHPLLWCYDADLSGDCVSFYSKRSSEPLDAQGKLLSITTRGDVRFQKGPGQHIETYSAENDTAGRITLDASGRYTFNFTTRWAVAPVCVSTDVSANPSVVRLQITTERAVFTGRPGHVVNYICMGNPN